MLILAIELAIETSCDAKAQPNLIREFVVQ